MREPIAGDRIAERADHRVLADQFGKGLRPIFARKDAVRPGLRGGLRRRFRAGPFPASRVRRRPESLMRPS